MAAPKRTKKQREYDLQEISRLYLQGWLQVAIVDHLAKNRPYTVTQAIISRDLKTVQERWQASSIRSFDEARARELAKIDNLELTYWSQWQASMDPIIRKKTAKRVNDRARNTSGEEPDWKTVEATQEVSLGTGNPRFLQGVQWCIDRRCKLLGLDAPTKNELTGRDGGPIVLTELTDEQLKRLAAGEDIADILADK